MNLWNSLLQAKLTKFQKTKNWKGKPLSCDVKQPGNCSYYFRGKGIASIHIVVFLQLPQKSLVITTNIVHCSSSCYFRKLLLSEPSIVFFLSVPSGVQGLTVSNSARSDYLKVSWLHASGYFDNYEVIIKNNNDFIQTKTVPKDENECVFTNLVPGRQYSVTVSTKSGKYETSERVYGRTSK